MSETTRIFDVTNVKHESVQHQQLYYFDKGDECDQRMTIYTGELAVAHGTESHQVVVDFEYPLLARFPPVGAGPRVGIFPINGPPPPGGGLPHFRSAVAEASIAVMWGKDEEATFGLLNVRAELDRIVLDDPRETIFAAVLKGDVISRYSHVQLISFRVSVLERVTGNPGPPQQRELGWNWNGKYVLAPDRHVGVNVWPGVPQT